MLNKRFDWINFNFIFDANFACWTIFTNFRNILDYFLIYFDADVGVYMLPLLYNYDNLVLYCYIEK